MTNIYETYCHIISATPQADTSKVEGEIDHAQRVAPRQLSLAGMIYELTEEEVDTVEGKEEA